MIYEYYKKKILKKTVKEALTEMWIKKPTTCDTEYLNGWTDCYWAFARLLNEIENNEHSE